MPDEPMSTNEIARMFNVEPGTVHSWRNRGRFPEPDFVLSATPVWWKSTVTLWAKASGKDVVSVSENVGIVQAARAVEQNIAELGQLLLTAQKNPSVGWVIAVEGIADQLLVLAKVVSDLSRGQDDAQRVEDVDWLKARAREAIDKLIDDRFDNWAHLTRPERQGLGTMAFTAGMDPSIHYTYPIDRVGEEFELTFDKGWTANRISADGKERTLEKIAEAHAVLVDQVRAWDVWRRIRPGPV
jgi:hypothetical protein